MRQSTGFAITTSMRTQVLTLSLFILTLAAPTAGAQTYTANSSLGNGIVNSAGQWASQIGGTGAQANRNAANQLFQQALQHEAQGMATLNVGLLSQALTESQQGIKADDQARHLAQTSLEALQTGETAGHVDLTQYGVTEDQLRDLANNSSPLLPQVQSTLSSFGISVDHSSAVVQSPYGSFPLDAGAGDVTKAVSAIAEHMGFSSADVAAGVQAGIANADGIGQKALADAQGSTNAARSLASQNGAAGAAANGKDAAADAAKNAAAKTAADAAAKNKFAGNNPNTTSEDDVAARMAALKKNRDAILKGVPTNALGEASSNLFLLVHDRYMEMDRQGSFLHNQQIAANPTH